MSGILLVVLLGWTLLGAERVEDPIAWLSLDEAQEQALEEDKIVFVFFQADWCATCREMKRSVFPEEKVLKLMKERFLAVRVDLASRETMTFEGKEMTERAFAREMQVAATPTMLFISPEGGVLGQIAGFLDADNLIALLRFVDAKQFEQMTFEEYLESQT